MDSPACIAEDMERFIFNAPDLLVLFSVATLLSVFFTIQALRKTSEARPHWKEPAAVCGSALLAYCFFFYFALPAFADQCLVLTRYYTVVMPFVILVVALGFSIPFGPKVTAALLGILLAISLTNINGRFYPDFAEIHDSNISIAERSMEYRNLLEIAVDSSRDLAEASKKHPIYVGLAHRYYLSVASLGYVDGAPISSNRLTDDAIRSLAYAPPDCAFIARNSFPHEQEIVEVLEEHINASGTHILEPARVYEAGRYRASAFRIRRIGYPCEL